jgi:hypothetical protein
MSKQTEKKTGKGNSVIRDFATRKLAKDKKLHLSSISTRIAAKRKISF